MNGIVLVNYGSMENASGAALVRLTERLRTIRAASVVEVGFLDKSHPTLAEAIEKCISAGEIAYSSNPVCCSTIPCKTSCLARSLPKRSSIPMYALWLAVVSVITDC